MTLLDKMQEGRDIFAQTTVELPEPLRDAIQFAWEVAYITSNMDTLTRIKDLSETKDGQHDLAQGLVLLVAESYGLKERMAELTQFAREKARE